MKAARSAEEERLGDLRVKWDCEKEMISQIQSIRAQLEEYANKSKDDNGAAASLDVDALRADLSHLNRELEKV